MAVLSPPQIPRKNPIYKLPFSVNGVHTLGVCPRKPASCEIYYVAVLIALRIPRKDLKACAPSGTIRALPWRGVATGRAAPLDANLRETRWISVSRSRASTGESPSAYTQLPHLPRTLLGSFCDFGCHERKDTKTATSPNIDPGRPPRDSSPETREACPVWSWQTGRNPAERATGRSGRRGAPWGSPFWRID